MGVVQMCGHLGDAIGLRDLHRRQVVVKPHHRRFAVLHPEQRAGNQSIEPPDLGGRVVRMQFDVRLLHDQFIVFRLAELIGAGPIGVDAVELMIDPFGRFVDRRGAVGRTPQQVLGLHRLLDRQARHRLHPRPDRRAGRNLAQGQIDAGQCVVQTSAKGTGAQASLRDKAAARGQQAETHHLAPIQLGLDDFLPVSLRRQRQSVFPTRHHPLLLDFVWSISQRIMISYTQRNGQTRFAARRRAGRICMRRATARGIWAARGL